MFDFWRRAVAILDRPIQAERSELEETTFAVGAERDAIQDAISIIQQHVDKEAQNRRVRELAVRDLCPMQKAELVKDLARVLR